ncbi:ROK family protein [Leptothrix discophora]|uniref:ROK family protein n=1 Tax=Leptothrix discophora TaxID=89 RepID=A0ABT9G0S4_LEPDI|nr:ROK family protein [Leptothrix discophora]MDP4299996.1 ROK family protein [Leptothrix discophora]
MTGTAAARSLAVGVDLGGTQVRTALMRADGELLARAAERTDLAGGPRAVVGQISRLVAAVTQDVAPEHLAGVGVSSPGPLDNVAGVVLSISTMPGWVDIPLVAWLTEALQRPVVLENDGVSAAIGEWRHGAGRGLSDFVYVTVSTGIGGGVIAGGQVLRGRRSMAAHIGHMTTQPQGETCTCGNQGCWEAQASGTAFGDRARRELAGRPDSALATIGAALDGRHVMDAARAGDALARDLVAHEAAELGLGIVNLLHIFSPQAVVIGGGVSAGFDLLQAGIAEQVRRRALPPFRDVPVVPAALGPNAGLVGAASLVLAA